MSDEQERATANEDKKQKNGRKSKSSNNNKASGSKTSSAREEGKKQDEKKSTVYNADQEDDKSQTVQKTYDDDDDDEHTDKDQSSDYECPSELSKESNACSLQSNEVEYIDYRETLRTMTYLIDSRDRVKVSDWMDRLDRMDDKEGRLERVMYVKYLVSMLSGSSGLLDPFNSGPPEVIKPLHMVVPPVVFADLADERSDGPCESRRRTLAARASMKAAKRSAQEDYRFFEQQLFPAEGLLCYAAAFSSE